MASLSNLSDPQTKEIVALFQFFDTNRDGLISPRSATKLCEKLGFHLEPAHFAGDPGSTPLALPDLLSWCNNFCGQCMAKEELSIAQRFALLRNCDIDASGQRVSREALMQFLALEQHSVRPQAIDALLDELGSDGPSGPHLTRADMAALIRSSRGGGRGGTPSSRRGGAGRGAPAAVRPK